MCAGGGEAGAIIVEGGVKVPSSCEAQHVIKCPPGRQNLCYSLSSETKPVLKCPLLVSQNVLKCLLGTQNVC